MVHPVYFFCFLIRNFVCIYDVFLFPRLLVAVCALLCVFDVLFVRISLLVFVVLGRKYLRIVFEMFLDLLDLCGGAGLESVFCVLVGFGFNHNRMSLVCCFSLVFSYCRH